MCALGSAVGSLFRGPAWRAERGRCWLHGLYYSSVFSVGAPVLAAQASTGPAILLLRHRASCAGVLTKFQGSSVVVESPLLQFG